MSNNIFKKNYLDSYFGPDCQSIIRFFNFISHAFFVGYIVGLSSTWICATVYYFSRRDPWWARKFYFGFVKFWWFEINFALVFQLLWRFFAFLGYPNCISKPKSKNEIWCRVGHHRMRNSKKLFCASDVLIGSVEMTPPWDFLKTLQNRILKPHVVFSNPKPQTPNPKPQTLNPKP